MSSIVYCAPLPAKSSCTLTRGMHQRGSAGCDHGRNLELGEQSRKQLVHPNCATSEPNTQLTVEDITDRLCAQYPNHLRPEITSVRIVQEPERVWLEIAEEQVVGGYLKDQLIQRSEEAFGALTVPPGSRPPSSGSRRTGNDVPHVKGRLL
jgi:hypothetical protein